MGEHREGGEALEPPGGPGRTGVPPVIRKGRRHLPHWEQAGATYFVSFRLRQGELSGTERRLVLDACLHWHERRWLVFAVTVMPDHVHVLAKPLPTVTGKGPVLAQGHDLLPGVRHSLVGTLHSIKSYTAHQINKSRGTDGPVWIEESYDRLVRHRPEYLEKRRYIIENAFRKGLVAHPCDYPFLWYDGRMADRDDGRDARPTGTGEAREIDELIPGWPLT